MTRPGWSAAVVAAVAPRSLDDLFADLNYLNLGELHRFCRDRGIPYAIFVETTSGLRRSRDQDRKSVVLDRVRAYLRTGVCPPPTVFAAAAVCEGPPPAALDLSDRLYYGWYDKHDSAVLEVLARATDGAYRNGAIARILMRDSWGAGVAPTFADFGRAWLEAQARGLGVDEGRHPEAAWLTDRARGTAGSDWKEKRAGIARSVLQVLGRIPRG